MNPLWATIPQCPKLHGQWGLKKPSLWPRSCWQVLISRRWKMLLFEQLNGSAGAYYFFYILTVFENHRISLIGPRFEWTKVRTVPGRSILMGQKLMENDKIPMR